MTENQKQSAQAETEATKPTVKRGRKSNAEKALIEENAKLKQDLEASSKRMDEMEKKFQSLAKNTPVINTERFEIHNEEVGQSGVRRIDEEGSLSEMINDKLDEDHLKKKADELAFMNEEMTITINPTTNRNEDKIVIVEVNGKHSPPMVRGLPVKVKRYYVENLLNAKQTAYDSVEKVDPNGIRVIEYPHETGLRYPFSVIHDPSGEKGIQWVQRLMRSNA